MILDLSNNYQKVLNKSKHNFKLKNNVKVAIKIILNNLLVQFLNEHDLLIILYLF